MLKFEHYMLLGDDTIGYLGEGGRRLDLSRLGPSISAEKRICSLRFNSYFTYQTITTAKCCAYTAPQPEAPKAQR